MKRSVAIAVWILACCAREPRVVSLSTGNSNSLTQGLKPRLAKAGFHFYSVEAKLPSGLDPANDWHRITLVDDAGQSHNIAVSHFSTANREPGLIGATFEIPANRHGRMLVAGAYWIDLRTGAITK
ncbi:MAG TPA: hypothetical protein VM733_18770 [Thermoanaerobaculia bacterium]|nr:hypothetical protein [Thermoanaerobaculia bacterium]